MAIVFLLLSALLASLLSSPAHAAVNISVNAVDNSTNCADWAPSLICRRLAPHCSEGVWGGYVPRKACRKTCKMCGAENNTTTTMDHNTTTTLPRNLSDSTTPRSTTHSAVTVPAGTHNNTNNCNGNNNNNNNNNNGGSNNNNNNNNNNCNGNNNNNNNNNQALEHIGNTTLGWTFVEGTGRSFLVVQSDGKSIDIKWNERRGTLQRWDWQSAAEICDTFNGRLAEIRNVEENVAVLSYLNELLKPRGNHTAVRNVFIKFGLRRTEKDTEWKWTDGTSATFIPWAVTEPTEKTADGSTYIRGKDFKHHGPYCTALTLKFDVDFPDKDARWYSRTCEDNTAGLALCEKTA
jgi:hypothetical protein